MPLLTINTGASAPTPTQIAVQDITQFNNIASLVHDRMLNGIAGVDQVTNQQNVVIQQAKAAVSAQDYCAGLSAAIGSDAFTRLQTAATALIGS